MKKAFLLTIGVCAAATGFLMWNKKKRAPVDELAKKLQDAWADHHTAVETSPAAPTTASSPSRSRASSIDVPPSATTETSHANPYSSMKSTLHRMAMRGRSGGMYI